MMKIKRRKAKVVLACTGHENQEMVWDTQQEIKVETKDYVHEYRWDDIQEVGVERLY